MEVSATDKVLGNQYDVPPRYFVYAGLVFTPLSLDYLKTFGRRKQPISRFSVTVRLWNTFLVCGT